MTPIIAIRPLLIRSVAITGLKRLTACFGLLVLGGCASSPEEAISSGSSLEDQAGESVVAVSQEELKTVEMPHNSGREPFISLGTDESIRMPTVGSEIVLEGEAEVLVKV